MFHNLLYSNPLTKVNDFDQANVAPLLPIQYHLELTYCNIALDPRVGNVIVPVPELCQPALVTVITMLPDATLTALNTLICPSAPAASVVVSPALVEK
jgi:hypothetical protein